MTYRSRPIYNVKQRTKRITCFFEILHLLMCIGRARALVIIIKLIVISTLSESPSPNSFFVNCQLRFKNSLAELLHVAVIFVRLC